VLIAAAAVVFISCGSSSERMSPQQFDDAVAECAALVENGAVTGFDLVSVADERECSYDQTIEVVRGRLDEESLHGRDRTRPGERRYERMPGQSRMTDARSELPHG
jgi:hypothetical protein